MTGSEIALTALATGGGLIFFAMVFETVKRVVQQTKQDD